MMHEPRPRPVKETLLDLIMANVYSRQRRGLLGYCRLQHAAERS